VVRVLLGIVRVHPERRDVLTQCYRRWMDTRLATPLAFLFLGLAGGVAGSHVFRVESARAAPPDTNAGGRSFEPARPLTAEAKAHLADVAATQLGAANRVSVAQPATARAWLSFFSADQVRGGPHASFARFAKNPTGSASAPFVLLGFEREADKRYVIDCTVRNAPQVKFLDESTGKAHATISVTDGHASFVTTAVPSAGNTWIDVIGVSTEPWYFDSCEITPVN
jgi:hypothetical protein